MASSSVAMAKADIFRKNDITVGVKFVKIWKKKIGQNRYYKKPQGTIKTPK